MYKVGKLTVWPGRYAFIAITVVCALIFAGVPAQSADPTLVSGIKIYTDEELQDFIFTLRGKQFFIPVKDYRKLNKELGRLKKKIIKEKNEAKVERLLNEASAVSMGRKAASMMLQGSVKKSRRSFEQALIIYQNLVVLDIYFQYLFRTGDVDQGITLMETSLKVGKSSRNRKLIALCHGNLGSVYIARGKSNRAEGHLKKALELDEKLGMKARMALHYENLALIQLRRGKLDMAEELLDKGLTIDEVSGNFEGLAVKKWYLAVIRENQNKLDEALILLIESRGIYSQLEKENRVIMADAEIARIQKILKKQKKDEAPEIADKKKSKSKKTEKIKKKDEPPMTEEEKQSEKLKKNRDVLGDYFKKK